MKLLHFTYGARVEDSGDEVVLALLAVSTAGQVAAAVDQHCATLLR